MVEPAPLGPGARDKGRRTAAGVLGACTPQPIEWQGEFVV
jgi:hypothetical protein